jgi:Membrane proteins related to metalloendopeptidases
MTRDGLVERNAATGEEIRVSQRGQDFELRPSTQETLRSFEQQAKAGGSRHQPPPIEQAPEARQDFDLRQNTQGSTQTADFSAKHSETQHRQPPPMEQAADFRQDIHAPDNPDYSPHSTHHNQADTPSTPMEAAQPTARSYEARSHEASAGPKPRPKQADFSAQNTTIQGEQATTYETPATGFQTAQNAEKQPFKHLSATENPSTVPLSPKTDSGRLKHSQGAAEMPPASGKQRGTKYQQQFSQEAAATDISGEAPVTNSTPTQSRRLRFGEESAAPEKAGKLNQHSTKYQQKFAPEAAKADSAASVSSEAAQPPKSNRLQFTSDEVPVDSKLTKLQAKSDKTAVKLEKARGNLPTKKRVKTQRVYDEAKGKAKTKFTIEKEVIPQGGKKPSMPDRVGKAAGYGISRTAINKVHQKIGEVEDQNVGVKAVHKLEQTAENSYRGGKTVRSAYRFAKDAPYRRVAKLEKKAVKTNIKLDYQKALSENPKLKSNVFSRMAQKQKIKRQYAKAAREAQKTAGKAAKKTGNALANGAKAVVNAVKSHPAIAATIGILALLIMFIMTSFSSCSNMLVGGLGSVFASSYLAEDADIDNAELIYTEWETDLQMQINRVESDYPGYDEYRYDVADIGHNPYELMAFLTAIYQDFTYAEAQAILQQIFADQYQLSIVEEIEVRYRTEEREYTWTDPDTGETYTETYEVEVPYDYYILNITLTARSFTDVVYPRIPADQQDIYNLLMQTKGNRQYVDNPFDFNWLPYVTSYYGYRVHPISGEKNYHKGVDIGLPTGTEIHAGFDGIVTAAGYDAGGYGNYVVIQNDDGVEAKYAHCDTLRVSVGQSVTKGDVIATVGNTGNSTGPHLHLEVVKDGQYLNPIYFAVTGDDGSGYIPPGSPGGVAYPDYPGEPLGDGSYAAMIAEAEKHLGKRYVFGASGPANFDCSGFVCWVLDRSGVHPMGRTNAQGLYNICTPVSPANAQPGDLIFFTGTYSTTNACSHVGIYVGNGIMLHCGNPIQYTSINTNYWQSHFYAFGRIN